MLPVENIGVTTRRWASWSGGSRPMKLEPWFGSYPSRIMIPPRSDEEENTSWLESIATMSWKRVTDQ